MCKLIGNNNKIKETFSKIKYNKCNKIIFKDSEILNIVFNTYDITYNSDFKNCYIFSDVKKYNNLEFYENNKYFNKFSKIIIPISLNLFMLSIGIQTETKKIEKEILKNKHKDILIIIENLELLSSDMQDFIILLIKHKDTFLKKYSKKSITIIYGTTYENSKFCNSLFDEVIMFPELNIKELFNLTTTYNEFKNIDYDKFEEIYQINLGNFNNTISTLRISKDFNYIISKQTLDTLLNNMICKVDENIHFKKISNQKVLKLFSIFPNYFDPYEVSNIDIAIDKYELEKNLIILENLFVLFKDELNYSEYRMLEQLKKKLLNSDEYLKKELFELYYQYLIDFYPIDFRRKIEIQLKYLKDEQEILYQYLLWYEYYFFNKMNYNIEQLIKEFETLDLKIYYKKIFRNISNFKYSSNYESLYKLYKNTNDKLNAFLLKKDIEYYSINTNNHINLKSLCDILYKVIIRKDYLKTDCLMRAIYLILLIPQYIDKFNDLDKAEKLIDEFNSLEPKSELIKEHIEYYKNILNRKSYLFQSTDIAIDDCKKALCYFESKQDLIESYMTLNTLLSLHLINDEINMSKIYKNKILKIKKDIDLPQYYKSEMNFILIDVFESATANYKMIVNQYLKILKKDITTTSKNIIYTNICALSLENNDLINYAKYKKIFENLNNIEDVSNIKDESVDDFYRYYFAWFEFGKNLINKNKVEATKIYISLKDFIPCIYKSESKILNLKYHLYKDILNEDIHSGKEFSSFVLKKKNNYRSWKFFSRGFMLSDIEHTSSI
ncbi:hypothetical protein ACSXAY_19025 (plasmid) [Clostridium perfringens]